MTSGISGITYSILDRVDPVGPVCSLPATYLSQNGHRPGMNPSEPGYQVGAYFTLHTCPEAP